MNDTLKEENAPIKYMYHLYVENQVWKIEQTTSHSSVQDSSAMVIFTLIPRRKPKFYVINLILGVGVRGSRRRRVENVVCGDCLSGVCRFSVYN
jgi:hypothetical protein